MFFPVFFVFAALIFETAKLSREKVRHQMGIDSGAYAEMSNMSDYINRTAYVNGAFPYRIFRETWNCGDCPNCRIPWASGGGTHCLYDLEARYYASFPRTDNDEAALDDGDAVWKISYNSVVGLRDKTDVSPNRVSLMDPGTDKNDSRPYVVMKYHYPCTNDPSLYPSSKYEDTDCGVSKPYPVYSAFKAYKWYLTVYGTLGEVQDSQRVVYEAIARGNKFLKRGYYLNAGSAYSGSEIPVVSTKKLTTDYVYYSCRVPGGTWAAVCNMMQTTMPGQYVNLFQSSRLTIPNAGGAKVSTNWTPPSNFFKYSPGSVSVGCAVQVQPAGSDGVEKYVNLEYGMPTPHYQTRLYPSGLI
ncbi:MAG: hypothetical protein GX410_10525 [Elusimicrobia bacterium]|nr:hypothetical protein [Elusimicrobiota bacterium]